MWERIQDTEASASVLWRKKKRTGEIPLHLQSEGAWSRVNLFNLPCEEVCNGTFCLSDWEISRLQSKHTRINTHRKTHLFSQAHVYSLACRPGNGQTT